MNLPASAADVEMQVLSLGCENPLEEGMAAAPRYSCLERPTDRGLPGYSPYASIVKVEHG